MILSISFVVTTLLLIPSSRSRERFDPGAQNCWTLSKDCLLLAALGLTFPWILICAPIFSTYFYSERPKYFVLTNPLVSLLFFIFGPQHGYLI